MPSILFLNGSHHAESDHLGRVDVQLGCRLARVGATRGFKNTDVGFEDTDVGLKDTDVGFEDTDVGFEDTVVGLKDTDVPFE